MDPSLSTVGKLPPCGWSDKKITSVSSVVSQMCLGFWQHIRRKLTAVIEKVSHDHPFLIVQNFIFLVDMNA
jgi:lipoate-protein ligase B